MQYNSPYQRLNAEKTTITNMSLFKVGCVDYLYLFIKGHIKLRVPGSN